MTNSKVVYRIKEDKDWPFDILITRNGRTILVVDREVPTFQDDLGEVQAIGDNIKQMKYIKEMVDKANGKH